MTKSAVRICSHLLKKSFMENFIFCTVLVTPFIKSDLKLALILLFGHFRSSHPEIFLGTGVLKIYRKFTGEHSCRSMIPIKLQSNFIEMTLRHGCSSVYLLHISRTPFTKNTHFRNKSNKEETNKQLVSNK